MFYYPNVLQRNTGCFSTIWLAATRGIRVTRRELLKVNVNRTCRDILDYVTAQVPPPQPSLPRPRFSLYLSSQLQYGVVVVYHQQCGFLLAEVQQTVDRLLRSKKFTCIDMVETDRLALDVPDSLHVMAQAEGAVDPFFGLMESHQLPSPYKILQPELVSEELDSQHSLVPSPHTALHEEEFRSVPAAITLREKEQSAVTATEYFEGAELPEATAKEIDLLIEQPDQFRGGLCFCTIIRLKETVVGTKQDSLWLLDQESAPPVEGVLAALAREMTPLHIAMPTPPSEATGNEGDTMTESSKEEAIIPPHHRKPDGGRRRQLVFADPHVQISDSAMKEQIGNPLAETLIMPHVMLDLLSLTKHLSPSQLFSAPTGCLLRADLQWLWRQCATLTTQPGGPEQQRREEEKARGESEQDREILRAERKRRLSSKIPKEKSGSDVITPVSRWSPQEENQLLMEPIAEEKMELPAAQTDGDNEDMLSWIFSQLQQSEEIPFVSLLPPEADRTSAACTLYKLLEWLSAKHVTVHQPKPYSAITICPAALSVTT
ncbi:REC8 meiotic recombination protein b [Aulostomus maculatus]